MPTRKKKSVAVSCPHCGKPVVWDMSNPYRPFCSERCKLIDLGQWAEEKYRIPDGKVPTGDMPEEQ